MRLPATHSRGFHGFGFALSVGFLVARGRRFGFTFAFQSPRKRRRSRVYGEIVIAIAMVSFIVVVIGLISVFVAILVVELFFG